MRQPERKWTNEEIAQASEKIKHSLVQKPENYPHPHDLIEKGRKYDELKEADAKLRDDIEAVIRRLIVASNLQTSLNSYLSISSDLRTALNPKK